MSVQPFIPPEWSWVYVLVCGQDWPQADEDAMRRCAQAWTDALCGLVALTEHGSVAAQSVSYSVQSISSDQFDTYWRQYVHGDDSYLGQLTGQCKELAQFLLQQSEQVEFTKLSINIQIVILVIQLIVDLAWAVFTAGASLGEGMLAAFATRMTVRQFLEFMLRSVLIATLPDVITQGVMLADHHRSSYDVGESLQAAQMGAVAGLVGMGLGRLGPKLTPGLENRLGKLGGTLAFAGLHGAATNVVTNGLVGFLDATEQRVLDPHGQQPQGYAQEKSGQNPIAAALNGAFTGLLFHGVHMATARPFTVFHPSGAGEPMIGVPTGDTTFTLFDRDGALHGTATLDGSRLTVVGQDGSPPRTVDLAGMTVNQHGLSTPVQFTEPEPLTAEPPVTVQQPVDALRPLETMHPPVETVQQPLETVTDGQHPSTSVHSSQQEPAGALAGTGPVPLTEPATVLSHAGLPVTETPLSEPSTIQQPMTETPTNERPMTELPGTNDGIGHPTTDTVTQSPTLGAGEAPAADPIQSGVSPVPATTVVGGNPSLTTAEPVLPVVVQVDLTALQVSTVDGASLPLPGTSPAVGETTSPAAVLPPGEPVRLAGTGGDTPVVRRPTPQQIEQEYGITRHNQKLFQAIVERFKLAIDVRPSNPESVALLEHGAVPKPEAIKAKTVNELDPLLASNDAMRATLARMRGAVGFFEPRLPDRPAEFTDAEWNALQARYRQRLTEYHELESKMAHLETDGKFHVVDGLVYPYEPAQIHDAGRRFDVLYVDEQGDVYDVLYADEHGNIFVYDSAGRPVSPLLGVPLNEELGAPIAGDHDMFDIRHLDGTRLTLEEYRTLVNEAGRAPYDTAGIGFDAGEMLWRRMGVRHGAHMYWQPTTPFEQGIYDKIVGSHRPGGEPLVRFQAGHAPMLVDSETPVLDGYQGYAELNAVQVEGDHLVVELAVPAQHPGETVQVVTARVDPLPHGRGVVFGSVHETGEALRALATRAALGDGFAIFGHADPHGFVIDGVHVPFEALLPALRSLPEVADRLAGLAPQERIWLYGCQAGDGTAAGLLAKATGHEVVAVTEDIWLHPDGRVTFGTEYGPDGTPKPANHAEAEAVVYHPDGQREPLAAGDPRRLPEHLFPLDAGQPPDLGVPVRLGADDLPGVVDPTTMFGPRSAVALHLPAEVRSFAGDSHYSGEGLPVPALKLPYSPTRASMANYAMRAVAEAYLGGARGEPDVHSWTRFLGSPERLAQVFDQQAGAQPRGLRGFEHLLAEAAIMHDNQLMITGGLNNNQADRVVLHGIPVTIQYRQATRQPGNIHVRSFPGSGSYVEIAGRLGEYQRSYLKIATDAGTPEQQARAGFDRQFAAVMLDLVSHHDPATSTSVASLGAFDAHTEGALDLAKQVFGDAEVEKFRTAVAAGQADGNRAWFNRQPVAKFLRDTASLIVCNVGVEGARRPENFFTGLMTWQLVAAGKISLDHAMGYFNIMGAPGAGEVARATDFLNDRAHEQPDAVPRTDWAPQAEEINRREREILGWYADVHGKLADLTMAVARDQPEHCQQLVYQLVSRLCLDLGWPPPNDLAPQLGLGTGWQPR